MLGSSDERLKRNLLLEGYSARGVPLYSWEYIEGHELISAAAGARSTVGYGNTSTSSSAKYGRYHGTTAQALLGMGSGVRAAFEERRALKAEVRRLRAELAAHAAAV